MPTKLNAVDEKQPAGQSTPAKRRHTHRTSFAAEVIRKFHRYRIKLRQKRDLEYEDEDGPPMVRYKPESLETIAKTTKFSKEEVRCIYRAFKQECPNGAITESTFKNIYAKFFPLGDARQYAHYVFATLDEDKSGTITFSEFMLGLSLVMKGTLKDRLDWAFKLYDVNHDGFITRKEMLDVILAIYSLMGECPEAVDQSPEAHVDKIFQKLDLNQDGVITVDEFINYCSKDENVCRSFAIFDDLW